MCLEELLLGLELSAGMGTHGVWPAGLKLHDSHGREEAFI